MMRTRRTVVTTGTLAGLMLLGAGPDSPRNLLTRANQAYRDGLIPRALDLYEEADELSPDDPTILYNWATALAGGDDRGLADRLFRKADMLAGDDEVRARARFNLAISLFTTASSLTEVDPQRAIAMFEDSAEAARACVRLRPDDLEAARHIEVARLAAQLVRDQLDLQKKLEALAREQREQAEQSQREAQRRREHRDDVERRPVPSEDPRAGEESQQRPQQQDQQDEANQESGGQGEERSAPDVPDFNLPEFLQHLLPQPDPSGERRRDETEPAPGQEPQRKDQNEGDGDSDTPRADGAQEEDAPTPPPDEPAPSDEAGEQRESPENGQGEPQDAQPSEDRPGGGDNERREQSQGPDAQAQRELNERTEDVAQTLRRAIEEDLVAGDRDFVEAVLRAIEEARRSQDQAQDQLERDEMDKAAQSQEQAASLLELAERLMNRGQGSPNPQQQDPQDQNNEPRQEGSRDDEQGGDPMAEALLDKERAEREMRRAYQRRILRGRVRPKKDW